MRRHLADETRPRLDPAARVSGGDGKMMGGIYVGFFTATEGAAMGAFGAMVFALSRRALTWPTPYAALLERARTTSMLFMILIGALIFAEFANIATMPSDLKSWVTRFNVSPIMVVAAICAVYVALGTAMEELSMIPPSNAMSGRPSRYFGGVMP